MGKKKKTKFMSVNELLTIMKIKSWDIASIYIYGHEAHYIKDLHGRSPDIDGDVMFVNKDSFIDFPKEYMNIPLEMHFIKGAKIKKYRCENVPKISDNEIRERAKLKCAIKCTSLDNMNNV